MKKFITVVIVLAIVAAGVVFVPKVTHTCDGCGEFFLGAGYEPNAVSDLLTEEEQIICKTCAEKQHAVSIALGKSVEEFKRELF